MPIPSGGRPANTSGPRIPRPDRWQDADAYERYIGRWSRQVARRFLEWLQPQPSLTWLEVGCGTGALTETILESAAPARILAIDPSEAFIASAQSAVGDRHVTFRVASAESLPFESATADVAVSGLVLNFVSDVGTALNEQARVIRPGGCLAAYVWDYAEGMQLIRRFWDAAVDLDPEAASLDEGVRFPITRPGPLESAWRAAGLSDVAVAPIEIQTRFTGFDELWAPFETAAVGPAPGYAASLTADGRALLRQRLQALLPANLDGSIDLTARAWAIRGRRP